MVIELTDRCGVTARAGDNAGRTFALGIDVGGTKVALAAVQQDGTILARERIENRETADAAALLRRVAEVGHEVVRAIGDDAAFAGVGVGLCELVDRAGEVRSEKSVPWKRAQIASCLAPLAPVVIDADVRVAGRAEALHGAGRGFSRLIFVTVGTGISHCLLCDAEPDAGAHGFAELVGSSAVTIPCGLAGPLITASAEDVASGPAIVARFNACTGASTESAEEVFRRAQAGDGIATRIVAEAATVLGSFIALLVNVLDPEAVVVGGGIGTSGGSFPGAVETATRAHIWAESARAIPIRPAELGGDAGVVGAALFALSRTQGGHQ